MNIPSWRHVLSYLVDLQVDYRPSDINGDLVVFLSRGKYQLCTANAIYSFEDRYDNFANLFRALINLEYINGNKVLILGLGLGSVPVTLDKLKPGLWEFTAVEIDETVCELASIYGYPKIISPIDTHITDAAIFMETCTQHYDLICLDVFVDDVIPDVCTQVDFLQNIRSCLAPNGLLIANTLAFSEEHRAKSRNFYDNQFLEVFPNAVLVPTHLNFMLLSEKNALLHPTST